MKEYRLVAWIRYEENGLDTNYLELSKKGHRRETWRYIKSTSCIEILNFWKGLEGKSIDLDLVEDASSYTRWKNQEGKESWLKLKEEFGEKNAKGLIGIVKKYQSLFQKVEHDQTNFLIDISLVYIDAIGRKVKVLDYEKALNEERN